VTDNIKNAKSLVCDNF